MRIFITGGTGFVGSYLTDFFAAQGHRITVLTRKAPRNPSSPHISYLVGDPASGGEWQKKVEGHEIVVNLAGAGIFKRWTDDYKGTILRSRLDTTGNLVNAVEMSAGSVRVVLSASAVGYYGFRGDEELTEDSTPGDDFLASVCRRWEAAAAEAEKYRARVVLCRLGIVLGKGGGALARMLPLYRWRVGSRLGAGNNWFSWIHVEDLARAFKRLMEEDRFRGPVNISSPQPVRCRDLHRALSSAVGRFQLPPPAPPFFVRMLLGEFGSVLLEGQRVYPRVLQGAGFRFVFPGIDQALTDLTGRPGDFQQSREF